MPEEDEDAENTNETNELPPRNELTYLSSRLYVDGPLAENSSQWVYECYNNVFTSE